MGQILGTSHPLKVRSHAFRHQSNMIASDESKWMVLGPRETSTPEQNAVHQCHEILHITGGTLD